MQPLEYISLAKPDNTFGTSSVQPTNAFTKATDQAVASHLQAQVAASGCANLEEYAVYLQLQYNWLAEAVQTASDTASSGHSSSVANNSILHSAPPPPPPPPPSTVHSDSYQSQTGTFYPGSIFPSTAPISPPRDLNSKVNSYGSIYSSPLISPTLSSDQLLHTMHANSLGSGQMLQDMQASSLSNDQFLQSLQANAHTACLQALPPAPQSAAFPGWANSSAMSGLDPTRLPSSLDDTVYFPTDQFSAPPYSAFHAQLPPHPDSQTGAHYIQQGYPTATPHEGSCRNSAGGALPTCP